MGNIADKKRLRAEDGDKIYKGDVVIDSKDEMMYIPFIKSGNKDKKRPWLYKGYYRIPDGAINMEAKRMEGLLELKVEIAEKHKAYLNEAIEAFTDKIYDESVHPVEKITIEEHETEIDVLKEHIRALELENSKAKNVMTRYKELLDEL